MKLHYHAIYKMRGANGLPGGVERTPLLALEKPDVTATLTMNPEPDFIHVDKSAALATQLLKGLFAPDKEGTPEERLAAEIEQVRNRRAKQTEKGVFVVITGETEIPTPQFKHRRDTDEFAICIDAIPKSQAGDTFRPAVRDVLAALSLSLPENADRSYERIGRTSYLVDPDSGKPIYSFSFETGGATLSVSSPLTDSAIKAAAELAPKFAADKAIARVASLLITSLEQATDELESFIASWSALSIEVRHFSQ